MRPAPFFVSGPVPAPVHCTGAGRSSGSGTVRLLRFGFRARFRSSLPLSRRSRLSRESPGRHPSLVRLPCRAPLSEAGPPGRPVPENPCLFRRAPPCRFTVLPRPYGPPPLALCPCPPTPVPSLCDNMAGAFLSACLSSFPDIASNLRGISYFLPAFVVSMCLWIYSVSRSGVSRSVLRCVSVPCLLLFSCFRPSAHCPAAFCAAGAVVFPSSRFCLYRLP